MKKSIFILCFSGILTLFPSCGKPRTELLYKINSRFYPFFIDFQEGSYWIYENEATKKIDSLYILNKSDDLLISANGVSHEAKRIVFSGYSIRGNPLEFTVSSENDENINIGIFSLSEQFALVGFSNKAITIENTIFNNNEYENIKFSNDFDLTQRKSGSNKGYPFFRSIVFVKGVGISHFTIENDEKLGDASFRLIRYYEAP